MYRNPRGLAYKGLRCQMLRPEEAKGFNSRPAVRIVLDGLWINLATAKVLYGKVKSGAILNVLVSHGLDVGLLYLGMLGPDDFTSTVHRDSWFISANL